MKMDDVKSARNGLDTSAALDIVNAAHIQARPVEWLWRDYLARGKLTLLGGDPEDRRERRFARHCRQDLKGGISMAERSSVSDGERAHPLG